MVHKTQVAGDPEKQYEWHETYRAARPEASSDNGATEGPSVRPSTRTIHRSTNGGLQMAASLRGKSHRPAAGQGFGPKSPFARGGPEPKPNSICVFLWGWILRVHVLEVHWKRPEKKDDQRDYW